MKRRLLIALFLMGLPVQVCLSQTASGVEKFIPTKACGDHDFEGDKYRVGKSRIHNPYSFLPWVNKLVEEKQKEISALVDGKPFVYETVVTEALNKIESGDKFLPDSTDVRVRFIVETISAENCSGKNLDLVYGIYSSQILGSLSSTIEARKKEKEFLPSAAGLTNVQNGSFRAIKFFPMASYDVTNKFSGGGRLEISPRKLKDFTFNSISLEGQISSKMRYFNGGFSGASDSDGRIGHSDWRLDYSYSSLPTEIGNIKSSKLSAQFSAITRSLADDSFTVRFGGLIEGGNQQSSIRSAPMATDTISNTAFGALKLYIGLDSRLRHNIFSANYGLQLGATGRTPRIDWVKHIADIKHEFWYPLGDHRILDLESQFTAGFIQVPGKIPVSERFFGGNNQRSFIPNNDWKIRENPVIRAIPGNRLFETADGIGANSFVSYNLTAAYTIWRIPLVPAEITSQPDFKDAVDTGLDSLLDLSPYIVKDPQFNPTFVYLEKIQPILPKFVSALNTLKAKYPNKFEKQLKDCDQILRSQIREIDRSLKLNADLIKDKYSPTINWGDGTKLKSIVKSCITNIHNVLPGETLFTAEMSELQPVQEKMNAEYKLIKHDEARKKAQKDKLYRFTSNTFNTLLYDVNMYSISPVFVFDVAKINPSRTGFGGVRYGPGLGLKLELVNSVNFTVGYAWNVRQRPGEGRGNVFFSFGVRDIFSFK